MVKLHELNDLKYGTLTVTWSIKAFYLNMMTLRVTPALCSLFPTEGGKKCFLSVVVKIIIWHS